MSPSASVQTHPKTLTRRRNPQRRIVKPLAHLRRHYPTHLVQNTLRRFLQIIITALPIGILLLIFAKPIQKLMCGVK